jgi:hypothetical protein
LEEKLYGGGVREQKELNTGGIEQCIQCMCTLNADVMLMPKCFKTTENHSELHTDKHVKVAQLVEALRYKPEGRGFDSRWCHWFY